MENLTYKDRLILKSSDRINRLNIQRMEMVRNSPQWLEKSREIGQEKEFRKSLNDGTATISNHPESGAQQWMKA